MFVVLFEAGHKTSETVRQSVFRRVSAFFDSGEGCFEHLLWIMWLDEQD